MTTCETIIRSARADAGRKNPALSPDLSLVLSKVGRAIMGPGIVGQGRFFNCPGSGRAADHVTVRRADRAFRAFSPRRLFGFNRLSGSDWPSDIPRPAPGSHTTHHPKEAA